MHVKKMSISIIGFSVLTYAQSTEVVGIETFWTWIALFALALVGIAILFISSFQTKKIQHLHQVMFDKQLEMEKNQTLFLTNMSENIRNIVQKTLEREDQRREETEDKEETLENVENRLLDVTNDLIDFLRLKSKKVEIINEEFNINNVLNELSGSICSRFAGSSVELIFDIDNNIPRRLIGDSLHLGQILNSILEHIMNQTSLDEVKLEISMFNTFEDKVELQLQFTDTGRGVTSETLETLFTPYYDEESGTYVRLGLFVAHELVDMMHGILSVQSSVGKGSVFTLTLPFDVVEKPNKRMYRLPEKIVVEKKVFIVDNNYNAALAIKKMFAYFKHEVKVFSKEEFIKNMPNLTPYDIVILNESLFNIRLVEYLKKIKMGKSLKVIALNSLIQSDKSSFVNDVIDTYLFKPLNQERIFEMIVDMYNVSVPEYIEDKSLDEEKRAKTHRLHISETKNITQSHFKDFSGKNILIVEDNLINQKVLVNLLAHSGIKLSIANNGKEAVDRVKVNESHFDLVLMDINMPIMDGYMATQMIRLDSKFDSLPIVAFTALVLDSEIQKMFNSGINAFLSKPLNIGKLYTALALYLNDDVSMLEKKNIDKKKEVFMHYTGLRVEEGIRHANNSEALYLEVLKEFSAAYGGSDKVLTKLVEEHRYEQIKMLCIDMRGLSGTIGAEGMYTIVNEILQSLLYNKQEWLPKYIEKYTFEMQTLNKTIQEYIASH